MRKFDLSDFTHSVLMIGIFTFELFKCVVGIFGIHYADTNSVVSFVFEFMFIKSAFVLFCLGVLWIVVDLIDIYKERHGDE